MYGEKMKVDNYDQTPTPDVKIFEEIVNRLKYSIERFDALNGEIRVKTQNILRLDEPNVSENVKEQTPSSFAEEMNRLICKFEENNNKLQSTLNHLNKII
jgi:hypothetical protein